MFKFRLLDDLISFLDPLLGATDLGAEVRAPLATRSWNGADVAKLGVMIHGAELLSPTAASGTCVAK
jgi:hypothetical protein